VTEVADNSPAAKAGIKVHHIIVTANGQPVASRDALAAIVQQAGREGKPLQLEVIQQGARHNLTVQPEGPPSAPGPAPRPQADESAADQARQLQELRTRVDHLQQLVEQLRRQVAELRHNPAPSPRAVD
jgi:membrane-associated protease RseP (regulator of RpoE activity)